MVGNGARWEIEQDLALYKFYLDLLIKAAVFVFGISGGITSYYLAHGNQEGLLAYSLLLPALVNLGFALICGMSAGDAQIMRDRHYELCEREKVKLNWELRPLPLLLRLFAFVYGAVGLALLGLLAYGL